MSIALWKTFLALAKTVAVVILVGAGALFYGHRRTMAEGWKSPDFSPAAKVAQGVVAQTGNLGLQLGRFQRERPKESVPTEEAKKPEFSGVLAQLGEITDAIVVYPPYEEHGLAPALIFKYRVRPAGATEDSRTIRLGEALIDKPHPQSAQHRIPVQFKFVGCERDPENPHFTFFLFDVMCDGKDIQRARWKLEEPVTALPKAADGPVVPAEVVSDKIFIGGPLSSKAEEPEKAPETVKTEVVPVPVAQQPPPEPVKLEQEEPAGTLFQQEDGIYAPTDDGVDYLERNYEDILKQTRTETVRDSEGGGIRLVNFANQSLATQFGLQRGDVILRINNTKVSNQSEAVNVVKQELKKKSSPILRVTIRRRGAEKELRFDTRDPATRRAAKKAIGK